MSAIKSFFKDIPNKFVSSSKELSSPIGITVCAMCLALCVVLGYFANLTLPFFGSMLKIGFSFIAIAVAAILYGPIAGAIVGGAGDVLAYVLSPQGAYFPGFTLNGILIGIIYGLFLYKNSCTVPKLIISKLIIMVFVDLMLSTLWLSILYGNAYWITLITRSTGKLILFVPECIIILAISAVLQRIPYFNKKSSTK